MKQFFITSMTLCLFLVIGCTDDEIGKNGGKPSFMSVYALSSYYEFTETSSDLAINWAKGLSFGVYMPESSLENIPFSATDPGLAVTFTSNDAIIVDKTVSNSIYAYYPYSESAGGNYLATALSLSASQTQSESGNADHLINNAFMYAQKDTITDEDNTLNFKHAFTVIRLDIFTGENYVNKLTLNSTTIPLAMDSGTINLATGEITVKKGLSAVSLSTTKYLIPSSIAQSCYMTILPGDYTGLNMLLELSTDVGTKYLSVVGENFEAGKVYVANLSTDVKMDYSVDLSAINWEKSFVHDIYDVTQTKKIGIVAKEYLGHVEDAQAIVVYPIDTASGKPDITKGIVTEVTLINGGSECSYIDAPENINSGTLSMEVVEITKESITSDSTIVKYTEGQSNAIKTIYFDENGNISLKQSSAKCLDAIIVPELLEAVDETSAGGIFKHRIVKIGSQFWIADDLRTTQNSKGAIPVLTVATNNTGRLWDETNKTMLYNGYAVLNAFSNTSTVIKDVTNRISPDQDNWTVPTSGYLTSDYALLLDFINGNEGNYPSKIRSDNGNNITNFSAHYSVYYKNDLSIVSSDFRFRFWSSSFKPSSNTPYMFFIMNNNVSETDEIGTIYTAAGHTLTSGVSYYFAVRLIHN